mmetsp:Transcript_10664/g.18845  ORF Transcript_10664/g.18845 Transcript_10664/m.18845 type:complete len:230 (+) Transcript_10664:235-924(+)
MGRIAKVWVLLALSAASSTSTGAVEDDTRCQSAVNHAYLCRDTSLSIQPIVVSCCEARKAPGQSSWLIADCQNLLEEYTPNGHGSSTFSCDVLEFDEKHPDVGIQGMQVFTMGLDNYDFTISPKCEQQDSSFYFSNDVFQVSCCKTFNSAPCMLRNWSDVVRRVINQQATANYYTESERRYHERVEVIGWSSVGGIAFIVLVVEGVVRFKEARLRRINQARLTELRGFD